MDLRMVCHGLDEDRELCGALVNRVINLEVP
jgi:hypothetical protein